VTPSPLPVTLLTGFLGSGKTTLLNRLLRRTPLTAVVMNEFGEVALDHQLLTESRGPLALLTGGCVCCQVVGALAPTLKNLAMGRTDGRLPPFERVIIETTGIADPAPVLATFLQDRWVAARYRMDGVVTTVDAMLGASQLGEHEEALRQVAVADRLVITKSDLADPEHTASLRKMLSELNPAAGQLVCVQGDLDPASVLDIDCFNPAVGPARVKAWLADRRYRPVASTALVGDRVNTPDRHQGRIRSFSLRFDAPLDWDGLTAAIEMLAVFRSRQLLRMKALVNVRGRAAPVVLHGVQHVFYPAVELDVWPDDDRASRFVFITDGLDEQFVAKLLEDFTRTLSQAASTSGPDSIN